MRDLKIMAALLPPGWVLLYVSYIGMCHPGHLVGFLCHFGLKMGMHFAHFGLELDMLFEGTTECMKVFMVSIPNE